LLFDEIGTQTREITFIDLVEAVEEQGRDNTIKDGVSEEFQAFVMQAAVAAMRKRLLQQGSVAERMT
jgi:hypothetical protein